MGELAGDQLWRLVAHQEAAPYSWCGSCDESWMGVGAHAAAVRHIKASEGCTKIRSVQVHTVEKTPLADIAAAAVLKQETRQAAVRPASSNQPSESLC